MESSAETREMTLTWVLECPECPQPVWFRLTVGTYEANGRRVYQEPRETMHRHMRAHVRQHLSR